MPNFSAGAMENWGLVKYREKMLLWTEAEETSAEQRSVVAVIAHELAHMVNDFYLYKHLYLFKICWLWVLSGLEIW